MYLAKSDFHIWQEVLQSVGNTMNLVHPSYTPVHLVESVENCGLCMRRYLACSSYANVMHRELAITRALRYGASARITLCAIAVYRLFHSRTQVLTFTDSTR